MRPPSLGIAPFLLYIEATSPFETSWSLGEGLYYIVVSISYLNKARDFGGHMVDGSIMWMFDVLGLIL
jgi:hypothetical protein